MMRMIAVRTASVALCISAGLSAQHVSADKMATSTPEHVLSGINVYSTNPTAVERRLGKPKKIKDEPQPDYPGSGFVYHWWEIDGVQLCASLRYEPRNGRRVTSVLDVVEVWGTRPTKGGIGITGAGLALGDTLSDVRRHYGSSMSSSQRGRFLQIYWKDGTELEITIDDRGRINRMRLLAQLE